MTSTERGDIVELDLTVVEVRYEPGTPDPGRVFRSMATLIDAFQCVDRDLARTVSVAIEAEAVLERVEAGSIRAILRTILRQVGDDALRSLDWKPLVGQYLVKAKHKLLAWLEEKDRIGSRAEILELQSALGELAPQSVQHGLLPPGRVPEERLLRDVQLLSQGVAHLLPNDSAEFVSRYERTRIETRIRLGSEEIENLLTQEIVASEEELVLLVKKPDYLGHSRWEFKLGEHPIEAKVVDEHWLEEFRNGDVVLKPGYSLRAAVHTETARGFEGNIVAIRYEVRRVLEVLPPRGGQPSLFETE